ncbi:MerR family transcriptional regulator [Campylobacter sp. US33a]|uniref:MerR family transcriptional regulator n=1 Tax=Campylobacter sp. US33a TaxID=2498120 RepID=UPI00326505AF
MIEVERKTGIPSKTIRFWADKGVFPYVEKDKMACSILVKNICNGCFGWIVATKLYKH